MMKNKLKAFTLAEVLITLGIVGVVAALTTPGLVQHAASAKIGPSFARSISTIEQGLQAFMFENDSNTLLGADPVKSKKPSDLLTELVNQQVKMRSGGKLVTLATNGISTTSATDASVTVFTLNDKSAVYASQTACNPVSTDSYCKLWILPTGYAAKKQLAIGEDGFEVAYDNHGKILIYGLDYGDSWESNCSNPKGMGPGDDKKSCGGRIAAMGFKKDF